MTGIVAVTSILSLFIWAQNFQLNQAAHQANPFPFKILLVITYYLYWIFQLYGGVNTLGNASCKSWEKRYEAYLDQRWKVKSRKLEPLVSSYKSLGNQAYFSVK